MKEYRQRIRNSAEKREEVLQKDRKRKQDSRLKEKGQGLSAEVKAHRDKLNRERVSKCRANTKLLTNQRDLLEKQFLGLSNICLAVQERKKWL
jgi:hypothetical protein